MRSHTKPSQNTLATVASTVAFQREGPYSFSPPSSNTRGPWCVGPASPPKNSGVASVAALSRRVGAGPPAREPDASPTPP
jgi:hypothetical protein